MYLVKYKVLIISIANAFFFNSVKCSHNETNDTITQMEEVFGEIDAGHNKLKKLFEDAFINKENEEKTNTKNPDCICTPYYLCYDGTVSRDGGSLLESRYNSCENPVEICCKEPIFKTYTESTCGYSGNITHLSTNGEENVSEFGEFPWTVIILLNNTSYQCVGSLIHPQVVLTAAHCVNETDNYSIRAGEWDIRNNKEPLPYQTKYVQSVIKHPDFNTDNLFYDVALLVLEEPFQLAENVKVVCLTEPAPYPLETNYDKCVATGWGLDKATGRYKRIMKKIEFSLIPREHCERTFKMSRLGRWYHLHRTFICALGKKGLDLCKGDGGGPLVCSIQGEPERYQQVGITSWGIGCEDKIPSVFAKVAQVRGWIDGQFEILQFGKDYSYDPDILLY